MAAHLHVKIRILAAQPVATADQYGLEAPKLRPIGAADRIALGNVSATLICSGQAVRKGGRRLLLHLIGWAPRAGPLFRSGAPASRGGHAWPNTISPSSVADREDITPRFGPRSGGSKL